MAEQDPHFTYHAVVQVLSNGWLYDPSYGGEPFKTGVNFDETFDFPSQKFNNGSLKAKANQVVSDTFGDHTYALTTEEKCKHRVIPQPAPFDASNYPAFVKQQYQDFLERGDAEVDEAGLSYWVGQITNAGCGGDAACILDKRVDVVRSFFYEAMKDEPVWSQQGTAEFNQTFTYMCYIFLFRREPDEDGYNNWLGVMTQRGGGVTAQNELIRAFIVSDEYLNRFK